MKGDLRKIWAVFFYFKMTQIQKIFWLSIPSILYLADKVNWYHERQFSDWDSRDCKSENGHIFIVPIIANYYIVNTKFSVRLG